MISLWVDSRVRLALRADDWRNVTSLDLVLIPHTPISSRCDISGIICLDCQLGVIVLAWLFGYS